MTDQYAVFGNPVEHSKSPVIHAEFAKQTQQTMQYDKLFVELGQFQSAAQRFIQQGGKGFNITVPFKEDAVKFADELSPRAEKAGAANTIKVLDGGKVLADNTDGIGLVRDISLNHRWQIADKTVLVIGAGGAVRGVLGPLLEQQPKRLIVANRTVSKAEDLAQLFAADGNIEACGFDEIPRQAFDLIINGTSASLAGELPPIPIECIDEQTCCYDMMYAQELTVFLRWAHHQGTENLADGLGMLVEQAAEAFYLWRGVMPNTAPVLETMRDNNE